LFHPLGSLSNLFGSNFPQIAGAATKVGSAPSQIVDISVIGNRELRPTESERQQFSDLSEHQPSARRRSA
jgi:hypothetical protein